MVTGRLKIVALRFSALIFFVAFLAPSAWSAEKYSVIYRFPNTPATNSLPRSGLTLDAQGNLYGVALGDCLYCSSGEVFELSPASGGGWTETILHAFSGFDGTAPTGGLVLDSSGNIYGTTAVGGSSGSGTVFELQKGVGGTWIFQTIYDFDENVDGQIPYGNLIIDAKGNLFGYDGLRWRWANEGQGSVFELSPAGGGVWRESWLHIFTGAPNDGATPFAGLTLDSAGNLYGSTVNGGQYNVGTIFKLTPNGSGGWSESIIFAFNFVTQTGSQPESSLVFDATGNIYGTTTNADSFPGNVFELSPGSGGTWNETVLYTFSWPTNCSYFCDVDPSGVVFDVKGNLSGVTAYDGAGCNDTPGCGTVYALTPQSGGTWKHQLIHTFESAQDGSEPLGSLVVDRAGNMFGTTSYGGNRKGDGTIFQIIP